MELLLIRKDGSEQVVTKDEFESTIKATLNAGLSQVGRDDNGRPRIVEFTDAEQAASDQAAADAEAARQAAEAAEAARLAARPKRSEINAAKAATQAATSVTDLRASVEGLIDLMDRVLLFQQVDVDEDA